MADTASEPDDPEAGTNSRDGAGLKGEANPEDETRRKFREALERKRAKEADSSRAPRRRPALPAARRQGRAVPDGSCR